MAWSSSVELIDICIESADAAGEAWSNWRGGLISGGGEGCTVEGSQPAETQQESLGSWTSTRRSFIATWHCSKYTAMTTFAAGPWSRTLECQPKGRLGRLEHAEPGDEKRGTRCAFADNSGGRRESRELGEPPAGMHRRSKFSWRGRSKNWKVTRNVPNQFQAGEPACASAEIVGMKATASSE